MRVGLTWTESGQVTQLEASRILEAATKSKGANAGSTQVVSLRTKKRKTKPRSKPT